MQVYKILNGDCPNYLSNYFTKCANTNRDITTRSMPHNVVVPKFKQKSGQRTFKYQGAVLWNELDLDVKHSQSLNCFKDNYLKTVKSDLYSCSSFWIDS